MKSLGSERGLTLAELLITVSLTSIASLVGAMLLSDYMATARTLRVQGDANIELVSLLKGITRDFQTSNTTRRACLLDRIADDKPEVLAAYNCFSDQQRSVFATTDGIGFNIDATGRPQSAYVNTCVTFKNEELPVGKGGRHAAPPFPNNLNWGGASKICPAECPAGQRPVVKFLDKTKGLVSAKQVPKASTTNSTLEVWGAVICGSEFEDLRQLQDLKSRQFLAQSINVLAFVARGRFDVRFPSVPDPADAKKKIKQSYVWLTGGIVLDFLDSQEMAIFRCKPNDPTC
ncbi:MAG: hypothetical protein RLZZ488_326 [Pseudomonadota bacterium]|jgi:Tfp pilus assembly protein PilE